MKGNWSQNLRFWLRNCLKLPVEKNLIFGSLQTILLCIVLELAGGGSVAVAVGISDMLQVKGDMRHLTPDT